jgi:hypothetical protein
MMMKDSESFYDTTEKNYTDPNDWNDEVFVKFDDEITEE